MIKTVITLIFIGTFPVALPVASNADTRLAELWRGHA